MSDTDFNPNRRVAAHRCATPRQRAGAMYSFSRAIYRELADDLIDEQLNPRAGTNRELVLHACEETMDRLADDFRYFANPDRALFEQIRAFFPLNQQLKVYNVVAKYTRLATEYVKLFAARGYKPDGTRLRCRATTRRSTPCLRAPVLASEYCPSHQHLAEPHFIRPAATAKAA